MKVLINNRQKKIRLNQNQIKRDSEKILKLLKLHTAELSLLFVNDSRMKILNSRFRSVNRATDVLSFPQIQKRMRVTGCRIQNKKNSASCIPNKKSSADFVLGDVVISLQTAEKQAACGGRSLQDEIRWLLVHGVLHLAGYDHEKSKYAERKMRKKEQEILKKLKERVRTECSQKE